MVKRYRLDEVAKIEEGKIVPKKKYFTNVGVPLITAENLKKLMLNGDIEQLPKVNISFNKHFKCAPVPAKTIILTKANLKETNKYIYQCEIEICIANDIVAIIPNETIILSDYLLHFLRWYQINKEWHHLYQISIDIPMLTIQHKMVRILNTIQLLLKNKESLMTAVEGLPQHLENFSTQLENHSKSLHHGFNQAQHLYNVMQYKIFKGELK
ncbi:restriction endonuclease subunit S [Lysinibacillus xylanilyticus]|uniref:Restriction endonuclease subunit S n=1 Tax=Lysinibacillus xylanilyticus TaxID=582475 RepID=A0ABT4EN47_9BACI|nr:restriction endonuclease subunit S [Lysinibacillus xylanilyticus]MCY9547092.1 restriction endonuclease subunit S [Lysinibacillus xylanilyticus]MED3801119.1 restriction endonuclease subunit S [Lysinibacillus xylanilyticus]